MHAGGICGMKRLLKKMLLKFIVGMMARSDDNTSRLNISFPRSE